MDPNVARIFTGRYFHINRKLLMCLGLWPYGNKYSIYAIRFIVIITLMILSVPQLVEVIVHTENVDKQMMGIILFLSLWGIILKIVGMILADENIKELHRRIADNWQLVENENERDILHEYAERARTGILYYIGFMGSAGFWCALPLVPKFLDIIIPLENPRPDLHLIGGEYFFDKKEHFTLTTCINYFVISYLAFNCAVFESMYVVSVEHCCSLYAIIRYRLVGLKQEIQENSLATEDDRYYNVLIETIKFHQDALTFTSLLNDSYAMAFLFLFSVFILIFPLTICAGIAQINHLLYVMPYFMYSSALLIQGFVFFCPGQRIIDHQISLCDAAYSSDWYKTPLRTRKVLLHFMLRCSEPMILTAGGLLDMNFELYLKITKTAVSYVTVALSFR